MALETSKKTTIKQFYELKSEVNIVYLIDRELTSNYPRTIGTLEQIIYNN